MGLNFRKSIKIGPGRVTFSKTGVSASVGVKGARITKSTTGRTTKTVGIPGTGIHHTSSNSKSSRAATPSPGAPPGGASLEPRHNFTGYSKAERKELAAQATPEDKRAAWRAPRDSLTLTQAAYRWRINQRILKWLALPAFVLLAVVIIVATL